MGLMTAYPLSGPLWEPRMANRISELAPELRRQVLQALEHRMTYANRTRRSGVREFAILQDRIIVIFANGSGYLYGPLRPGTAQVRQMQTLAHAGRGLASYICRELARDAYEAQLF